MGESFQQESGELHKSQPSPPEAACDMNFVAPGGEREVLARIYDFDLVPQPLQEVLVGVGLGVFHVSIEVFGREWAYGKTLDEQNPSGVFCHCPPGDGANHRYRQSIRLGHTPLSQQELRQLMAKMRRRWIGRDYHVLSSNCIDFAQDLCSELGVASLPPCVDPRLQWRLAGPQQLLDPSNIPCAQRSGSSCTGSEKKAASTCRDVDPKVLSDVQRVSEHVPNG